MEQKITAVTTYDAEAIEGFTTYYLRRFHASRYAWALGCVLCPIGLYLWYGINPPWFTLYFLMLAAYYLLHTRRAKKRFITQFEMREREVSDTLRTFQCEFTDEYLIKHNDASGETRKVPYSVIKHIYDLPDFFILVTQANLTYLIDKRTLENADPAALLTLLQEKNAAIKYENLVTSRRHLRTLLIPIALFLAFLVFRYFYFMSNYMTYYFSAL